MQLRDQCLIAQKHFFYVQTLSETERFYVSIISFFLKRDEPHRVVLGLFLTFERLQLLIMVEDL